MQGINIEKRLDTSLRKIAKALRRTDIHRVQCYEFDDRAAADDWIIRRHGRDLGGEGRISWGPLEIQRFQKDNSLIDLLDFVEKTSEGDATIQENAKTVREKPYILRRLTESKAGKELLALSEYDDKDGYRHSASKLNSTTLRNRLRAIFQDVADGHLNTRTLNKSSDIESYTAGLRQKLGKAKRAAKATPVSELIPPAQKAATTSSKSSSANKGKRVRGPRSTLAASKHIFNAPKTEKGKQLLREASTTKLLTHPLCSAFVLRAFIQHAVDDYMTKNSLPFWERNKQLDLTARTSRVIDHLIQQRRGKAMELRAVKRMLTSRTDATSIQALNDVHHDRFHIPPADALRNGWESAVALFVAVYGEVK